MFKLFGGSERSANCDGFLFETVDDNGSSEGTLFGLQSKSPTNSSVKDSDDSSSSLANTFDDISSSLSFPNFTSASPMLPIVTEPSAFDQLRLTQECLETSATYMNEIESFFQQLSTGNSGSASNSSSTISSASLSTLSPFEFDLSLTNIDPSIFINQNIIEGPEDCNSYSSSKHSFESARNPHSSHNTRQKAPKFYSRSGQIADPSRGPCHNCHTTLTCYWRKLKGEYHCNACTLFFKRNKYHRNVETAEKPIKRRNRKSKYSATQ